MCVQGAETAKCTQISNGKSVTRDRCTFLIGSIERGGRPLRRTGSLLRLKLCFQFGNAYGLVYFEVCRVVVFLCEYMHGTANIRFRISSAHSILKTIYLPNISQSDLISRAASGVRGLMI